MLKAKTPVTWKGRIQGRTPIINPADIERLEVHHDFTVDDVTLWFGIEPRIAAERVAHCPHLSARKYSNSRGATASVSRAVSVLAMRAYVAWTPSVAAGCVEHVRGSEMHTSRQDAE